MFEQHQTKHKANQSQATERRVHNGVIDFFDIYYRLKFQLVCRAVATSQKLLRPT